LSSALQSQTAPGPKAPPAGAPRAAVFKNLKVLKDAPPDQLVPAMRFIAASLGVECNYCHVPEHFDRDDKKPKQIARDMMRMMFAINRQNFEGSREVTCYSCHRGAPRPEAIPAVGGEPPAKEEAAQPKNLPQDLPTVDQILDHYIQAMG